MRAFVIDQLNHPSKIELTTDAPEPKLVPGGVPVDVYSAGLNFFDVSTRAPCPLASTNMRLTTFDSLDFAGPGETPESPRTPVHPWCGVRWYCFAGLAHPSGLSIQTRR